MSETNGAEHENEEILPVPEGGLGGSPGTTIDQRTPGRDLKLIGMAVRRKWKIRDAAFDVLPDAFLAIAIDKEIDPRARVAAGKLVKDMNGQNESLDRPEGGVNVNVGVNITEIALHPRSDFYGPASGDLPAVPAAASGQGTGVPGTVQGGGVRPAVGQNGHGANGHAGGTRSDAGGQEGGH